MDKTIELSLSVPVWVLIPVGAVMAVYIIAKSYRRSRILAELKDLLSTLGGTDSE